MRILYTKHAIGKFEKLKEIGVKINRKDITAVVINPEHIDRESDSPKIIASKSFDKRRILRVVFKEEGDKITIITFYPAKKGRYYEEKTIKN